MAFFLFDDLTQGVLQVLCQKKASSLSLMLFVLY